MLTIKYPENDWLNKTDSYLIGELIFILSTDWMAKEQLNFQSNINAYCQQNRYVQLAKYTTDSL